MQGKMSQKAHLGVAVGCAEMVETSALSIPKNQIEKALNDLIWHSLALSRAGNCIIFPESPLQPKLFDCVGAQVHPEENLHCEARQLMLPTA